MKIFKVFIFVLFCSFLSSCSKNRGGSPTMSASVNNGSSLAFSASYTNQITILGSGDGYTISINLILNGAGTYTLADPITGNYATVVTNGITYTTGATSTGQVSITPISGTSLYNGAFYFAALHNGYSIIISNGQLGNM